MSKAVDNPFGKKVEKIREELKKQPSEIGKYRKSPMDMLFYDGYDPFNKTNSTKFIEKQKILAGPRCDKCGYYADRTVSIYIRMNHKLFGPHEYCQECLNVNDERFDKLWKRSQEGGRPITVIIKTEEERNKEALEAEMDIYRRKEVPC